MAHSTAKHGQSLKKVLTCALNLAVTRKLAIQLELVLTKERVGETNFKESEVDSVSLRM